MRTKSLRPVVWPLHLFLLPATVILFIYNILPMVGLTMAFQKFRIELGFKAFFLSHWVGLANFKRVLLLDGSLQAFENTLWIAFLKMLTGLVVPMIVALLLNEVRKVFIKRGIQTLIYLPYFLSWVVLGGILKNLLGTSGFINTFLVDMHILKESIFFLGSPELFVPILITSHLWQTVGFSTIVFLATITGISPALYESAMVDGANRWQQTWHITLPGMKGIIILCAVLSLGQILNAGFDQVFNLYSVPVYPTGDILDTFVYRTAIVGGQYEVGTAVGLLKSLVSFIFISIGYWLAYRLAKYRVF